MVTNDERHLSGVLGQKLAEFIGEGRSDAHVLERSREEIFEVRLAGIIRLLRALALAM
jgi:hypothetical protein